MLTPDTQHEIALSVRSGFYSKDQLLEMFCEEKYEPGELDPKEVRAAIDVAWDAQLAEQRSWPDNTDCDKLDRVFAGLNREGIIALQNAGYTQSDGYDDISQCYQELDDKSGVAGYCFYHGQDLERAVDGHGLFLAFGPVDPKDQDTLGPEVGRKIVAALARAGFETKWNGTFAERIHVPCVDWKKRLPVG